jgi:hypothetical protein
MGADKEREFMNEQEYQTETYVAPVPAGKASAWNAKVSLWWFVLVVGIGGLFLVSIWTRIKAIDEVATPSKQKPEGGYWSYRVKDFKVEASRSAEMAMYREEEFKRDLNVMGNDGAELVALIAVPANYGGNGLVYRAIFKQRAKRENYIPDRNKADFDKAWDAESKADREAIRKF